MFQDNEGLIQYAQNLSTSSLVEYKIEEKEREMLREDKLRLSKSIEDMTYNYLKLPQKISPKSSKESLKLRKNSKKLSRIVSNLNEELDYRLKKSMKNVMRQSRSSFSSLNLHAKHVQSQLKHEHVEYKNFNNYKRATLN